MLVKFDHRLLVWTGLLLNWGMALSRTVIREKMRMARTLTVPSMLQALHGSRNRRR